jgi:hypothetical protein
MAGIILRAFQESIVFSAALVLVRTATRKPALEPEKLLEFIGLYVGLSTLLQAYDPDLGKAYAGAIVFGLKLADLSCEKIVS